MIDIYKSSWAHLRGSLAVMICFAVLLELADFATGYWDISSSATFIAQLIIMLYLHRLVLFDEKIALVKSSGKTLPIGHFIWASVMVIIFAGLLAFLPVLLFQGAGIPGIALWIIGFTVTYYVMLILLGTSMPAAAAGDRYNPKISLSRARTTWRGIAGGLLIGPALFYALLMAFIIYMPVIKDLPLADYTQLSLVSVSGVVYGIILHLAGLFASLLAIVVLCRAYLSVAPPEVLEQVQVARQSAV